MDKISSACRIRYNNSIAKTLFIKARFEVEDTAAGATTVTIWVDGDVGLCVDSLVLFFSSLRNPELVMRAALSTSLLFHWSR